MSDDIYNDILWRLRIPLPYELRGLTVQDIANERKNAADEIERLRALAEALYEECKRCGSKHDVKATNHWAEYDQAVRGE